MAKKKGKALGAELRKLKKIQAVYNNDTLKDAYKELHPKAGEGTAEVGGSRMLTPDVFEGVKELLKADMPARASKDLLERILLKVIAQWTAGGEKTSDAIAAIRELARLVPEFSDKIQIEDISKADEKELDRKLRGFGLNPDRLN